jgi:hypothetical protein
MSHLQWQMIAINICSASFILLSLSWSSVSSLSSSSSSTLVNHHQSCAKIDIHNDVIHGKHWSRTEFHRILFMKITSMENCVKNDGENMTRMIYLISVKIPG